MDRHESIQPLLTDYALGELSENQRVHVQAHLETCADCAAEARELADAFHLTGLAVPPLAPPPHLRGRVLGALGPQRRRRSVSRARPPVRALPWAAAAAAALLLGTLWLAAERRAGQMREALRAAAVETEQLRARLEETGLQADLAVAILTAADVRRVDLEGHEANRGSVARAFWSPATGLLIVADPLAPPPPGRTYQVWIIESGRPAPVSAGLIERPQSGRGMLLVPTPAGVSGQAVTIAVTDEPVGGLPAPSGRMQFAGS